MAGGYTLDVRAAVVAGVIAFATAYVFLFQSPLFMANPNASTTSGAQQVSLTAALPESPPTPWSTAGLAYSCGSAGPGIIQLTNRGSVAFNVVAVSLSYGGSTYSASGPSCSVTPGNSVISVSALGAQPSGQGSQFSGYLVESDGSKLTFSGIWS